jgi:hypothetical protein
MVKKKKDTAKETAYSKSTLEKIKEHAANNEIEIVKSNQCGCFFCRQIYSARQVQDWINDGRGISAICPECGTDAVIGDAAGIPLEKSMLKAMNLQYFGLDYMEKNPDAARVYCQRYLDAKITHKEKNEALFLRYLSLLASQGDPKAARTYAEVYDYGDEFTAQNSEQALILYKNPALAADPVALCRRGVLYLQAANPDRHDNPLYFSAYECFSKAAALGSIEAVYHLADCYENGFYVDKDPAFAYQLLISAYGEAYARFTIDHRDWYDFPDYAYRLARMFQQGIGVAIDENTAIRLYLLAELSYNLRQGFDDAHPNPGMYHDIEEQITAIAKAHHLHHHDPVFDADTFAASFTEGNNPLETKQFSFVDFDRSSGDFSFDVTYPNPPLIIDVASLYAGFVAGTIRWTFNQVADVKASSRQDWQKLSGDNDDGWQFIHLDEDGSEDTIAEFRFCSDPQKDIKGKKIVLLVKKNGKRK